jgi:hypothetical protein
MPDKYKANAGDTYRHAIAPMKLPRTRQNTKEVPSIPRPINLFQDLRINSRSIYAEVTIVEVIPGTCPDRANATCAPEAKESATIPKS